MGTGRCNIRGVYWNRGSFLERELSFEEGC